MSKKNDIHVEIAMLQKQIEDRLDLEGKKLVFDFEERKGKVHLDLITVNPVHRQSFLLHSVTDKDKLSALRTMLGYLTTEDEKENSYTVQWTLKGEGQLHTSYFRSKNITGALEKLFYNRDRSSIIVFSVSMNPIA
ncbi:MAG: hypothetical protein ACFB10_01300 [Salibacteraceae bacterium]